MKRPQTLLWVVLSALAAGAVLLIVDDPSGKVFGLESETFARTLYLSVLLVVLGSALVFSGRPFAHMLRNLAVWLVLLALLVGGYQYRYELQDVASRVTAGLIPGSPIVLSSGDGQDRVMLEKSPGGHFSVRAAIDGKPVTAMIDTGATRTVLASEDAERLGFDPSSLNYVLPVMTANGTAKTARVQLSELRIGSITRRDFPVLVARPGTLDRSLLGMDFIGTLSGFELRGDRLILRD